MDPSQREPDVPPNDRDEELLQAARSAPEGDLRAFEELVMRHQRRILANCRFLTRDPMESEDLAQEVFVKAYFGLDTFEGRSSFRHWLQRIKVNHCLNHIKRRATRSTVDLAEESALVHEELRVAPAAERNLETAALQSRVITVLESMPDTLRIPLVMCDMDELSYEEIAATLGIGLSATKMRIKRGREMFRARFAALAEGG